jgi:hypothetical protein
MIRIVGIQRHEDPRQEFVLLQNQGSMKLNLRGYALVAERAMDDPAGLQEIFLLRDDVDLLPGNYALVISGPGRCRWCHKTEGYHVYYAHLDRETSIWERLRGPLHLLAPSHSYVERATEPLFVGRR